MTEGTCKEGLQVGTVVAWDKVPSELLAAAETR